MRLGPSRSTCFLVGGVLLATAGLLTPIGQGRTAAPTRAASASITSVTFSGSPTRPIVTVSGHGLVVPTPTPKGSPSNQTLCPKAITGNAGLDYGTGFYLTAFADTKFLWAAGRYRPALNELDCIGIIVLSHTPTKVRFTFGAAYRQADFGYTPLVSGDLVEMVVRNAAFGQVVRYH